MLIAMTPGTAVGPLPGNDTFWSMSAAEPRRSRSTSERSRSRSSACASAVEMSDAAGFSAGSASSGAMIGHLSSLSAAGGRPDPNVDVWPVQSMRLNQSPELKLLRSSDFERSSSVPACQNDGDCDSVAVASDSVFMRMRSAIGVSIGQLQHPEVVERLVVVGVEVVDRLSGLVRVAGWLPVVVERVSALDAAVSGLELVAAQVAGQAQLHQVGLAGERRCGLGFGVPLMALPLESVDSPVP